MSGSLETSGLDPLPLLPSDPGVGGSIPSLPPSFKDLGAPSPLFPGAPRWHTVQLKPRSRGPSPGDQQEGHSKSLGPQEEEEVLGALREPANRLGDLVPDELLLPERTTQLRGPDPEARETGRELKEGREVGIPGEGRSHLQEDAEQHRDGGDGQPQEEHHGEKEVRCGGPEGAGGRRAVGEEGELTGEEGRLRHGRLNSSLSLSPTQESWCLALLTQDPGYGPLLDLKVGVP